MHVTLTVHFINGDYVHFQYVYRINPMKRKLISNNNRNKSILCVYILFHIVIPFNPIFMFGSYAFCFCFFSSFLLFRSLFALIFFGFGSLIGHIFAFSSPSLIPNIHKYNKLEVNWMERVLMVFFYILTCSWCCYLSLQSKSAFAKLKDLFRFSSLKRKNSFSRLFCSSVSRSLSNQTENS